MAASGEATFRGRTLAIISATMQEDNVDVLAALHTLCVQHYTRTECTERLTLRSRLRSHCVSTVWW
jgi:hypothetical protein